MNQLSPLSDDAFRDAVLTGLARSAKEVPARYFYDERGSQLFEQITQLDEYYPTRTEIELLLQHAPKIAELTGHHGTVVEFGAGSATKTPILLDALSARRYIPVDISGIFLSEAMHKLALERPNLQIVPVVADFTEPFELPETGNQVIGFFPGSTVGNFRPDVARRLMRSFRNALGNDAWLVIGIDTQKDPALLKSAYDDGAGVTAAFNLNLLHRINRELDGTIPTGAFRHRVVWNDKESRIEMHLVATDNVTFSVSGQQFALRAGEAIHTENSYKYSAEQVHDLATAGGWEPVSTWTDHNEMFGLHLWSSGNFSNRGEQGVCGR